MEEITVSAEQTKELIHTRNKVILDVLKVYLNRTPTVPELYKTKLLIQSNKKDILYFVYYEGVKLGELLSGLVEVEDYFKYKVTFKWEYGIRLANNIKQYNEKEI